MSNSRQVLGIEPASIRWNVVRGDTSSIRVQFLESDEVTSVDTSEWIFEATAYNPKDNSFDDLDVQVDGNDLVITAYSDLTEYWGRGVGTVVGHLSFDLQVIIDRTTVWTPIVGDIVVIGDVTGGRL